MTTVVESNLKVSIATIPKCFPGLFHLILNLYLIMMGVKQGGIK